MKLDTIIIFEGKATAVFTDKQGFRVYIEKNFDTDEEAKREINKRVDEELGRSIVTV
jgi:hypothetical protein